jgi:hypothetical protein
MGPTDNTAQSEVKWQQIVTAVAAAAGGAAWVSAVGSGIVALRLRQADLPVEPVVALMSTEHRFAIGAGILAAPLLAASIGFLVDWLLTPTDRVTPHKKDEQVGRLWRWVLDVALFLGVRRLRQGLAAVTVLLGLVLVYLILRPPPVTLALEGFFVVVAVALASISLDHRSTDPDELSPATTGARARARLQAAGCPGRHRPRELLVARLPCNWRADLPGAKRTKIADFRNQAWCCAGVSLRSMV